MALRISSNKNDGAYSQPEWLRVLQGVLSFGISENHMSGYGKLDDDYNAYLDDIDLLESYDEQLNNIQGQLIPVFLEIIYHCYFHNIPCNPFPPSRTPLNFKKTADRCQCSLCEWK